MTIKNGDMPAMPVNQYKRACDLEVSEPISSGMTKREMMAMHMMASICIKYGAWDQEAENATLAVECADALLAELERTK